MRKVLLAVTVMLAGAGAVMVMTRHPRQSLGIGVALLVVGLALLVLARTQLGKSFSIGPRAKALVAHGLYAKIPHPMYVFLDVAVLGLVIAIRWPWLTAAWLALIAAHVWAARRESAVLERAFGERVPPLPRADVVVRAVRRRLKRGDRTSETAPVELLDSLNALPRS